MPMISQVPYKQKSFKDFSFCLKIHRKGSGIESQFFDHLEDLISTAKLKTKMWNSDSVAKFEFENQKNPGMNFTAETLEEFEIGVERIMKLEVWV
jgi:hypothetical protein